MRGLLGSVELLGCLSVLVVTAGCSAAGVDGDPWVLASAPVLAPREPQPVDCSLVADPLPPPNAGDTPLTYWAEDAELRTSLRRVLGRLNAATGLGLSVAQGGVLVEFVDDMPPAFAGFASDHIKIAEDPSATWERFDLILLHEVSHFLGAKHLGPGEGVMSRCLGASSLLTKADLNQICSAAPCTKFQPELSDLT